MSIWKTLRAELLPHSREPKLPPFIKVPVLPLAMTQFAQRADDPHADPADLAKIIEADSGLTLALLRYVNSSALGLRQKIYSAQHAIAALGVQGSKLFILTCATRMFMSTAESKLMNVRNFWSANLERALFAREVALLLNADPELAFAAAMLQDFLLPRLTSELYSPYLRFTTEEGDLTLPEFETQELGWDHSLAAASFMRRWNFPDDLVVCVLLHHRGLGIFSDKILAKTAAAAVAVSALLPEQMRQVPRGIEQLQKLAASWPRFDLLAISGRVAQQYQEMSPGPIDDQSIMRRLKRSLSLTAAR